MDLAVTYLTPLIDWLSTSYKTDRDDLRNEAAGQAICDLSKEPSIYDPNRGKTLFGFLRTSAKRDLQNLLAKEERHNKNREFVELSSIDGKYSRGADGDPSVAAENREEAGIALRKILPVVREGLSEVEKRVLDLILDGEKKTSVFAQACGISDLPKDEQEKEVKRLKGKVNKRIERARQDHG